MPTYSSWIAGEEAEDDEEYPDDHERRDRQRNGRHGVIPPWALRDGRLEAEA